ncbi:MAG TPA: glycosyltransferase [Acidimicrobiales bacterium]|nr:glycosyltransferase [Acidimicrobiales bacterium]
MTARPALGGTAILRLITRLNIGGPARQALLLTKGLSQEFPTVLAAGRPLDVEGELADPDVAVHALPLVRPVRPLTDVRAVHRAGQLMRQTGAGLVHTHMAKAGAVGRLAALTYFSGPRRPKLVHTFHGHVLQGYFGGLQQTTFIELERRLARRTDALIAVSPEVRDELLDLRIGTKGQYHVVPLGFELGPLLAVGSPACRPGRLRAAAGVPEGVPLVGSIGRLVPIKDHATLFRALLEVPRAHLAVLGDGELRGELEALAGELEIADRTHFLGWWPDIPAALADIDLVALSSRNEGTPVALIEALAGARPVVATDVGGVRHVVQEGETGWLCPRGDPAALAALIRRGLAEPGSVAQLAQEGRRRMIERFGYERMLADHAALYRDLLGRPEAKRDATA